ncbi:MAG: peptidase [Labilithrix sp.]|nr:peptidase [Labilithrix sp.]
MSRRVRIGQLFGVAIVIDWSWIFTFVLAAWTLMTVSERVLPALRPGALILLSAAAAIGLFASLALHEIAHGLAARACGVPVRRLTLFLFGGITDVESAPSSPRSEIVAACVAPTTNALAGAALLGVGLAIEPGDAGWSAAALLVRWLGAANLAIAAFNLLPAFPLDGGRLVRAAIWRATGDVERATRWAALGAQVVGWSCVVLGVAVAFGTRGHGALAMWIAFTGWFLASAAAQAYEGVRTQTACAVRDFRELEK